MEFTNENQKNGVMFGLYARLEGAVPPSRNSVFGAVPDLQELKNSFYSMPAIKQELYAFLIGKYTYLKSAEEYIKLAHEWAKSKATKESDAVFIQFSETVMHRIHTNAFPKLGVYL